MVSGDAVGVKGAIFADLSYALTSRPQNRSAARKGFSALKRREKCENCGVPAAGAAQKAEYNKAGFQRSRLKRSRSRFPAREAHGEWNTEGFVTWKPSPTLTKFVTFANGVPRRLAHNRNLRRVFRRVFSTFAVRCRAEWIGCGARHKKII